MRERRKLETALQQLNADRKTIEQRDRRETRQ